MKTATDDGPEELGLRERKKQQTRQAIHEAAFHLVDGQGLEATTVDEICTEADVSTRTFFNYFPSKAGAALGLSETAIADEVRACFLAARGGLVSALCDVIGNSAEIGHDHAKIKKLLDRRPELLTAASQIMIATRGQFIALAAERTDTVERAELAVTLVMAALGRILYDEGDSGAPLADQLRATVARLVAVSERHLGAST